MCNQDESATSPFSPDKAKNFAKIFRCSSAYFFLKSYIKVQSLPAIFKMLKEIITDLDSPKTSL